MSGGAFDLAVVGAGFGGSLLACIARRLGLSVALVEKGSHPRFAIGESSAPLANVLLEELADRYELDRIRPLSAYGTWLAERPELDCGLKRGFTFYGERQGELFRPSADRERELLVEASPHDAVGDTHWMRSDVDRFLASEAARLGAEYFDRTSIEVVARAGDRWTLEGERAGRRVFLRARLLFDATGPRGLLAKSFGLPESRFPDLPRTSALYAHFEGSPRMDELADRSAGPPPYAPDDAAVHHVFPGGWVWVLRFRSGIVSAGIAADEDLAAELALADGEPAWRRLLRRYPTLAARFDGARAVVPFVHAAGLPFRVARATGDGWALLPSAAAFVDPMLSTGFPLTLLGIDRIARALEEGMGSERLRRRLAAHGRTTLDEADAAARLVAALWASFSDIELFSALSLLYFAAASYAEAARRLLRGALVGGFLSFDRPEFGRASAEVCGGVARAARRGTLAAERAEWIARIYKAIEPLDVAGFSDPTRRRRYPVEAAPLLAGAGKLEATAEEVLEMLARTGFVESRHASGSDGEGEEE